MTARQAMSALDSRRALRIMVVMADRRRLQVMLDAEAAGNLALLEAGVTRGTTLTDIVCEALRRSAAIERGEYVKAEKQELVG